MSHRVTEVGALPRNRQQIIEFDEVLPLGEIYGLQLENVQVLDYALALQTKEALADARETIAKNRDISRIA